MLTGCSACCLGILFRRSHSRWSQKERKKERKKERLRDRKACTFRDCVSVLDSEMNEILKKYQVLERQETYRHRYFNLVLDLWWNLNRKILNWKRNVLFRCIQYI